MILLQNMGSNNCLHFHAGQGMFPVSSSILNLTYLAVQSKQKGCTHRLLLLKTLPGERGSMHISHVVASVAVTVTRS